MARLRALFTRKGREGRDLPEWADEYVAATGGLRDVLGLLDWPGAAKVHPPLAGVAPVETVAGENRGGDAGAVQLMTATIAVAVVIAAPDDPGGASARNRRELGEHLAATRAALIGWCPPEAGEDEDAGRRCEPPELPLGPAARHRGRAHRLGGPLRDAVLDRRRRRPDEGGVLRWHRRLTREGTR